jgi:hypothetical protein
MYFWSKKRKMCVVEKIQIWNDVMHLMNQTLLIALK